MQCSGARTARSPRRWTSAPRPIFEPTTRSAAPSSSSRRWRRRATRQGAERCSPRSSGRRSAATRRAPRAASPCSTSCGPARGAMTPSSCWGWSKGPCPAAPASSRSSTTTSAAPSTSAVEGGSSVPTPRAATGTCSPRPAHVRGGGSCSSVRRSATKARPVSRARSGKPCRTCSTRTTSGIPRSGAHCRH